MKNNKEHGLGIRQNGIILDMGIFEDGTLVEGF